MFVSYPGITGKFKSNSKGRTFIFAQGFRRVRGTISRLQCGKADNAVENLPEQNCLPRGSQKDKQV